MNKIIFFTTALFFIFSFTFTACDKDEIAEKLVGKTSCKIDDNHWETSVNVAGSDTIGFAITATKGKNVIILGYKDFEIGTYPLSIKHIASYTEDITNNDSAAYLGIDGNISITEINSEKQRVSGNFEFIGVNLLLDTIIVSEGKFSNILYTD